MVILSTLVFSVYETATPKRDTGHEKHGQKTLQIGGESIIHEPLMPKDKIIFPHLHIKLGLMKQYVKALDKDEHYFFRYLCSTLPGRSKEKLKAEIFVGPKIWKMIRDKDFMASITTIHKKILAGFCGCGKYFPWGQKSRYLHGIT